jgi:hypothetical protein
MVSLLLAALLLLPAQTAVAVAASAAAAASLASRDASVVVAESEEDAVERPSLFLALIVTEYAVLPLKLVIVNGDVVVPADVYAPPFNEYS